MFPEGERGKAADVFCRYGALAALRSGKVDRIYDSIIIDEAQDLEAVKLRLISESTLSPVNNLLILSDLNQRIFKLTSWKKESGIDEI